MTKQCENCIHNQVCAIKQDYDKYVEGINEGINKLNFGTTDFDITLSCKHFKNECNTLTRTVIQDAQPKTWPVPYIGDNLVTY